MAPRAGRPARCNDESLARSLVDWMQRSAADAAADAHDPDIDDDDGRIRFADSRFGFVKIENRAVLRIRVETRPWLKPARVPPFQLRRRHAGDHAHALHAALSHVVQSICRSEFEIGSAVKLNPHWLI